MNSTVMPVGRLADVPALVSLGRHVSGVETSRRHLMENLRTSMSQGLPRDVIYSSVTFENVNVRERTRSPPSKIVIIYIEAM